MTGQNPVDRVRFAATAPNSLWVTASQDKTLFAHLGLNFLQVESLKDLLALKNALDSPDVFPFPSHDIGGLSVCSKRFWMNVWMGSILRLRIGLG